MNILPRIVLLLLAIGTPCLGQVESAGELFVDLDFTSLPEGPVTSVPNNGSLGGFFEAKGGGHAVPRVRTVIASRGIWFDGTDYMELVRQLGGLPTPTPPGLVGMNPTRSIEVWVLNRAVSTEETMVAFGRHGGPVGSTLSFN